MGRSKIRIGWVCGVKYQYVSLQAREDARGRSGHALGAESPEAQPRHALLCTVGASATHPFWAPHATPNADAAKDTRIIRNSAHVLTVLTLPSTPHVCTYIVTHNCAYMSLIAFCLPDASLHLQMTGLSLEVGDCMGSTTESIYGLDRSHSRVPDWLLPLCLSRSPGHYYRCPASPPALPSASIDARFSSRSYIPIAGTAHQHYPAGSD